MNDAEAASPGTGQTLAHIVFERLRRDIVRGAFQPGDKLRFDLLRARYGLSVGGLREALSRLVAQGLVVGRSQRGFTVAPACDIEMGDVAELRSAVGCMALRKAIERGDMDWERRVVAALHTLLKTPRSDLQRPGKLSDEWSDRHEAFHEALIGGCGSSALIQTHAMLFDRSERYRRMSFELQVANRAWKREHSLLARAALDREADLACTLLRSHIMAPPQKVTRAHGRTKAAQRS
jgi:GntR family carbon starvation induced transcriptional regulator